MSDLALPGSAVTSPSGLYRLIAFEETDSDGNPTCGFRIEDLVGRQLLTTAERWSTRHRLYILWGEGDSVWIYSGDVGTSIWIVSGNSWQSIDYSASQHRRPPR